MGRASVPAHAPVTVDLVVESTLGEALTLHGTVRAPWRGECRRCLELIEGTLEVEVRELYERHPTDEDSLPIEHDAVDLTPVVHDAVVLALPLSPLCRPDCAGPSPDDYPVALAADEPEPRTDERWAVLDELTFDESDGD